MKYFAFIDDNQDVTNFGMAPDVSIYGEQPLIELDQTTFENLRRARTGAYVVDGVVVPRPQMPTRYHEWDTTNKQWVLNQALQIASESQEARAVRDKLLTDSDWTDTLSSKNRLGEDLYNQWQAYRQALRDVPEQAGFPLAIVWPTPPE